MSSEELEDFPSWMFILEDFVSRSDIVVVVVIAVVEIVKGKECTRKDDSS